MIGVYGIVLLTGGLYADPGAAFSLGVDIRGTAPENPRIPTYSFGLEMGGTLPGRVYATQPINPDAATFPTAFDVSQFTAAFIPCARWRYAFGCGVVQGGFFFVADGRYTQQTTASLALGPRLGVRLPLGERFALFAFGQALFAPVRTGFFPAAFPGDPDPNVQWRVSAAQGYGAAGVEFTIE